MDTTFTKNTGHPFFHEWTSNQRSGRATNTTRLQIAVRVFLVPIKIPNMSRNGRKINVSFLKPETKLDFQFSVEKSMNNEFRRLDFHIPIEFKYLKSIKTYKHIFRGEIEK